jgi:rubredoxin
MAKYRCLICQYIYNEKTEGVPFEDLPSDWTCPVCGAGVAEFEKLDEEGGGGGGAAPPPQTTPPLPPSY